MYLSVYKCNIRYWTVSIYNVSYLTGYGPSTRYLVTVKIRFVSIMSVETISFIVLRYYCLFCTGFWVRMYVFSRLRLLELGYFWENFDRSFYLGVLAVFESKHSFRILVITIFRNNDKPWRILHAQIANL